MDPYDDIDRFEKMMRKMIEGLFGGGHIEVFAPMRVGKSRGVNLGSGVREPLTDINETKDQVIVTMELPGATKEDIHLEVTSNGIEISARTQKVSEAEGVSKRAFTQFKKFMSLPVDVDPDSVDAQYRNGILEVKLKKLKQDKGRKVKIK